MEHGFVRIGVGIPLVTLADCERNLAEIKDLITQADTAGVDVLVFPELALTGATCGDLFFQSTLLAAAERALGALIAHTAKTSMLIAIGLPVLADTEYLNCAAMIQDGKLLGLVPKRSFLNRFFVSDPYTQAEITFAGETVPFGRGLLFPCPRVPALAVGIETGKKFPAAILLDLDATPEQIGKAAARRKALAARSAERMAAIAYAGAGIGESTTDAVFSGHGLIAADGHIHIETDRFAPYSQLVYCDINMDVDVEDLFTPAEDTIPCTPLSTMPYLPPGPIDEHCREIFDLQTAAFSQRLRASGCKTAVLGISGGLDSTLALLVTANAYDNMGRDRADILAITMPGFGTTDQTLGSAVSLMTHLGVSAREISIKAACLQHFSDIGHNPAIHDVTFENTQARERTQILMDLANQTNGLVVGSGTLSELALGWATYGGDHMSMYAVNSGLPKTLVRKMVEWLAQSGRYIQTLSNTLQDILDAPVSPELLPPDETGQTLQKTEDAIGPYVLHDFFLYYVVRYGFPPDKILTLVETAFVGQYDRATILTWLTVFYRRFFTQQFKRSCMPDGPQVGPISLSPRDGWRMPSDAAYAEWQRELEALRV